MASLMGKRVRILSEDFPAISGISPQGVHIIQTTADIEHLNGCSLV